MGAKRGPCGPRRRAQPSPSRRAGNVAAIAAESRRNYDRKKPAPHEILTEGRIKAIDQQPAPPQPGPAGVEAVIIEMERTGRQT